jgi:hypothetical protein
MALSAKDTRRIALGIAPVLMQLNCRRPAIRRGAARRRFANAKENSRCAFPVAAAAAEEEADIAQ